MSNDGEKPNQNPDDSLQPSTPSGAKKVEDPPQTPPTHNRTHNLDEPKAPKINRKITIIKQKKEVDESREPGKPGEPGEPEQPKDSFRHYRIPLIFFDDLHMDGVNDKGKGGGGGGSGGEGGGGAGGGGGRRGGPKNKRSRDDPPVEDDGAGNRDDDGIPPILITLLGMKKGPGGPPSQGNDRKKRKGEGEGNGPEDFYAYFREAPTLTPIEKEIKTLDDLIALGKTYDPADKKRYVIQMRALHKCVPVLEELNAMIGMKNVKSMIMDLLFFRLQNIEDGSDEGEGDGTEGGKGKEKGSVLNKDKDKEQDPLIDFFGYDPFVNPDDPGSPIVPPASSSRRGGPRGGGGSGGCCGSDEDGEEAKLQVHTMESLGKETGVVRDMYHMVITGSPGCGKTEVAKILAKLYYCLGIARKDKFTLARRSDLIGKYLGHTAKMTQDVFHQAKGGILFIDEAYALGNPEGKDSFSKECIDTINQNLTENKDTIVFIAGYKDQLEESFFAYNPGLHRRFKFRLEVDKYNAEELRLIYLKKIRDAKWGLFGEDAGKAVPVKLFEKHREIFKFNGGDMENLWHLTKIVHARRIFGKDRALVKKISEEDVKRAIELYMENDEVKKRNDDVRKYIQETVYI